MRTFFSIFIAVLSVALLFWQLFSNKPFIPTMYSWIMKIPLKWQKWIIGIMAVGMLIFICYRTLVQSSNSGENHTLPPLSTSVLPPLVVTNNLLIPDINTNYEAALAEEGDNGVLMGLAKQAFREGSYAYCILLEKKIESHPNDQAFKTQTLVFSLASSFAQNPTEEGWGEFTNRLNNLVVEIELVHMNTNLPNRLGGYFTHRAFIGQIATDLDGVVKKRLPVSRREYINSVVEKLSKYEAEAPNP